MPMGTQRWQEEARAALLPRELLSLFDDAFVRSCQLIEEYVVRLALGAFRATGLERALAEPATVDEVVVRAGLVPAIARVPVAWLARTLAARAWIESDRAGGDARYRLARVLPVLDPNEILAEQEAVDARCLPSYRIAALAAECYPAVLRGEVSGEQALFGPEGIVAWSKYFSNANPLYATSNAIAAIAAERALPSGCGPILELGGGVAARSPRRGGPRRGGLFVPIDRRFAALSQAGAALARNAISRAPARVCGARHRPAVRHERGSGGQLRARLRGQRRPRVARPRRNPRRDPHGARGRRPARARRVRPELSRQAALCRASVQPARGVPRPAPRPGLATERRVPRAGRVGPRARGERLRGRPDLPRHCRDPRCVPGVRGRGDHRAARMR